MKSRLQIHLWSVGVSQTELAVKTGIHRSEINRAVKHGIGSKRTKSRIAQVLDVPIKSIFPEDEGGGR